MSETKFVQGIPEVHANNPSRVLMRRVSDGSKFVVLLMDGSVPPNIGTEKKYPYTTFVKEENGMKYYQEVSAPMRDIGKPVYSTINHETDKFEDQPEVPVTVSIGEVNSSLTTITCAAVTEAASAGLLTVGMDEKEREDVIISSCILIMRAAKRVEKLLTNAG